MITFVWFHFNFFASFYGYFLLMKLSLTRDSNLLNSCLKPFMIDSFLISL